MEKYPKAIILIIIGLISIFSSFIKKTQKQVEKIIIKADNIVQESGTGSPERLIDEQITFGGPSALKAARPRSVWEFDKNKLYSPFAAILHLERSYLVTSISFYDTEESGGIVFYGWEDSKWKVLFSDSMDKDNVWRTYSVHSLSQFFRLEIKGDAVPAEIVLYGEPSSTNVPSNQKIAKKSEVPTFENFVGINAFIDDPLDNISVSERIREYHDWKWNATGQSFSATNLGKAPTSPHIYRMNPSYPGWDFDLYYSNLRKIGTQVMVCMQHSLPWLTSKNSNKPLDITKGGEDPLAYASHSAFMYQYAARYATKIVPDSNLLLDKNQKRISGLSSVKSFENWNEPDKWWEGRDSYFRPFEFAALSSADYDGHLGTLGKKYGVKNADETSIMVLGGLARLDTNYLKAIKIWALMHRNGSFPFDVINLHYYTDNPKNVGLSPEEDGLKIKFRKVVAFCKRNFPGIPIWVTEFGYDTHPSSKRRCGEFSDLGQEKVQAIWLARGCLEASASGIDRFYLYMLRDVNGIDSEQYATSGLTRSKDEGLIPKPSWYFLFGLKGILRGFVFQKELSANSYRIYVFAKPGTSKLIYAIWQPVHTGFKKLKLNLPVGAKSVNLQQPSFDRKEYSNTFIPVNNQNGSVELLINDIPTFVVVN